MFKNSFIVLSVVLSGVMCSSGYASMGIDDNSFTFKEANRTITIKGPEFELSILKAFSSGDEILSLAADMEKCKIVITPAPVPASKADDKKKGKIKKRVTFHPEVLIKDGEGVLAVFEVGDLKENGNEVFEGPGKQFSTAADMARYKKFLIERGIQNRRADELRAIQQDQGIEAVIPPANRRSSYHNAGRGFENLFPQQPPAPAARAGWEANLAKYAQRLSEEQNQAAMAGSPKVPLIGGNDSGLKEYYTRHPSQQQPAAPFPNVLTPAEKAMADYYLEKRRAEKGKKDAAKAAYDAQVAAMAEYSKRRLQEQLAAKK